jgi:16S rRNA (uracil1498-N3)-methyltransferase
MDRFYAENMTESSQQIELSQDESHHLAKVLRKHVGEEVELINGKGLKARAVVSDISRHVVTCKIYTILPSPTPTLNIQIALSCIRPNRMDWAIEKLTEIGITEITPLFCDFTSVRHFKMPHNRKIAVSALKQSGNPYLPEIHLPRLLSEWISQIKTGKNTLRIVCHLGGHTSDFVSLKELTASFNKIVIAIGPEGGFSKTELNLFEESGFINVKLADYILRTETAAVVAAAQTLLLKRE